MKKKWCWAVRRRSSRHLSPPTQIFDKPKKVKIEHFCGSWTNIKLDKRCFGELLHVWAAWSRPASGGCEHHTRTPPPSHLTFQNSWNFLVLPQKQLLFPGLGWPLQELKCVGLESRRCSLSAVSGAETAISRAVPSSSGSTISSGIPRKANWSRISGLQQPGQSQSDSSASSNRPTGSYWEPFTGPVAAILAAGGSVFPFLPRLSTSRHRRLF